MKKKLTWSSLILLFSLYSTQYLALGFFMEALIGILRQKGFSLENIGFIYMLGLFWVFRFLWAPFIDRFHFKSKGHYKIWIIIFQSLMTLSIIIMANLDIEKNLSYIIFLSILIAFFAASQSTALDAFSLKLVFKKERSLINAIKVSGGLIGMVLGGGVGLILYDKIYWSNTLYIMATLTAVSLIQIILFNEPKKREKNLIEKIDYKQFLTFWYGKQKKLWLILLFLYPATVSASFGLSTPILVDFGWSLAKIGFAIHIIAYGIGFFASFGASYLIKKISKKTILVFAAIGQIVGILLMLLIFEYHHNEIIVMLIIGFIFAFYTPSQVLMSTIMMDLSSSKSPASQFAVQHSVFMFSGILFSSIAVSISGILGYEKIIFICAFVGVLAMLLSTKIEYILKKENSERD